MLFEVIFFGIFIFTIIRGVLSATKTKGNSANTQYSNNVPQGQPNKYKPITSHYSQATLRGTGKSNTNAIKVGAKVSPMDGTFIANKEIDTHDHVYEHKVKPIDEASVHERFEERKENYRERKAQMKADLPKTSYSEVEEKINSSNGGRYRSARRNSAKNGDNGWIPNESEKSMKCSYCGANNIIPCNASVKYNCYFCREEL